MNFRTLVCIAAAVVCIVPAASAQDARPPAPPKLVLTILVDQLRYDYLERYHHQFVGGSGGLRLLTDRGAFMTQAHYDYMPTVTAPGHASVFSGAGPAMHGIISNDWYDKRARKTVYCCGDKSVSGVGTTSKAGQMSPVNFIGANFADQLRMAYPKAKVVGISIKDRGAILPAGKKPAGAYWFEAASGNFITSTYYKKELPAWVQAFNARKLPASYVGQKWERLLPESEYERPDLQPGEGNLSGEKTPTFPHTVVRRTTTVTVPKDETPEDESSPEPAAGTAAKPAAASAKVEKEVFDNILLTPYSNELLAEFARAAIEGENLGAGPGPDMLSVSFSAVDACGHRFGPYSQEVQDIVLRLDRQLASLFAYVDKKIGLANVVITITADHAVAPTPEFAKQEGFDGQRPDEVPLMADLMARLGQRFGVANIFLSRRLYDGNLYFNHDLLREKGIAAADAAAFIRDWALNTGKFHAGYTRDQILEGRATGMVGERVTRGFNGERSGDVVLIYKPFTIPGTSKSGTTHGSPWTYDTHVPVIFYGTPFKPGRYADEFNITDFVPTLSAALRINEPPMCIGKPLVRALAAP